MSEIFYHLFKAPLVHIHRLITNPNYSTYYLLEWRFGRMPRFTPFRVRIHNLDFHAPDASSFLSTYREIYLNQIYAFRFEGDSPRILDLGANIGLSVMYFKRLFPQAIITAFEADPIIYQYLEENVRGNGYSDVELLNKAAWNKNMKLYFTHEGADAGQISLNTATDTLEVEAVDMQEFLAKRQYDFIKMDIEGAEAVVLSACRLNLTETRYIFVEYHSCINEPQHLAEVISILTEAGFRLALHQVGENLSPILKHPVNLGKYDFQANIFGWRED